MPQRILVIDDDAKARALVAAILEPVGYQVIGAENGRAGLGLAASHPPDLVVLDVQMPGMDGYEVCRILRKGTKTREVPILMLTSTDDPALNRKAYAAGAVACVPKPFRREGLLAAIAATLTVKPKEATPPTV
jgi:CheY-like chemotaxis protein